MEVLAKLNDEAATPDLPSDSLLRVLQELLDRESFQDEQYRVAALADVNAALSRDELQVFLDERGRAQVQNIAVPGASSRERKKAAPWTKTQADYRQRLSQYLDKASEDDFTEHFLHPLFQTLGFDRISVTGHADKRLEFGKDLWMKLRLPTGHWIYFGCQAKQGKIDAAAAGPNTNIATVLKQVEMMVGHPVFDADDNRKHLLDHVFIVSAGEITKAARAYLGERLDQQARRHVIFMDRGDLLDFATRGNLPIPGDTIDQPSKAADNPPF